MVLGFFNLKRNQEIDSESSSDDESQIIKNSQRKMHDTIISYRGDDDPPLPPLLPLKQIIKDIPIDTKKDFHKEDPKKTNNPKESSIELNSEMHKEHLLDQNKIQIANSFEIGKSHIAESPPLSEERENIRKRKREGEIETSHHKRNRHSLSQSQSQIQGRLTQNEISSDLHPKFSNSTLSREVSSYHNLNISTTSNSFESKSSLKDKNQNQAENITQSSSSNSQKLPSNSLLSLFNRLTKTPQNFINNSYNNNTREINSKNEIVTKNYSNSNLDNITLSSSTFEDHIIHIDDSQESLANNYREDNFSSEDTQSNILNNHSYQSFKILTTENNSSNTLRKEIIESPSSESSDNEYSPLISIKEKSTPNSNEFSSNTSSKSHSLNQVPIQKTLKNTSYQNSTPKKNSKDTILKSSNSLFSFFKKSKIESIEDSDDSDNEKILENIEETIDEPVLNIYYQQTFKDTQSIPPSKKDNIASPSRSWLHKMHSVPVESNNFNLDTSFHIPKNTQKLGKYGRMLYNSILKIQQSHALQVQQEYLEDFMLVTILQAYEQFGTISLFCEILNQGSQDFKDQFIHIFLMKKIFIQFNLQVGSVFKIMKPYPDPVLTQSGLRIFLGIHLISKLNTPEDWNKRRVNNEIKRFCNTSKISFPISNIINRNTIQEVEKENIRQMIEQHTSDHHDYGLNIGLELEYFQAISFIGTVQRVFNFSQQKKFILIQIVQDNELFSNSFAILFPATNTIFQKNSIGLLSLEGTKILFRNFYISGYKFYNTGDDMYNLLATLKNVEIRSQICVIKLLDGESSTYELKEKISSDFIPQQKLQSLKSPKKNFFDISGELILVNSAEYPISKFHKPACIINILIQSTKEIISIHITSSIIVQDLFNKLNKQRKSNPIITLYNLLYSISEDIIFTTSLTSISIKDEMVYNNNNNNILTQDLTQSDSLDIIEICNRTDLLPIINKEINIKLSDFIVGKIGSFHLSMFPTWNNVESSNKPIYWGCSNCRSILDNLKCKKCSKTEGKYFICISASIEVEDGELIIVFSHEDILSLLGRTSMSITNNLKLEKIIEYMKPRFPKDGISFPVQILHKDERKCIMATIGDFESSVQSHLISLKQSLIVML